MMRWNNRKDCIEIVFDLNLKDWMAVFFRLRKTCPECARPVHRRIKKTLLSDETGWHSDGRLSLNYCRREVKEWQIRYECVSCDTLHFPKVFW